MIIRNSSLQFNNVLILVKKGYMKKVLIFKSYPLFCPLKCAIIYLQNSTIQNRLIATFIYFLNTTLFLLAPYAPFFAFSFSFSIISFLAPFPRVDTYPLPAAKRALLLARNRFFCGDLSIFRIGFKKSGSL